MVRLHHIALAVALCGLALALSCFPLSDADTWWHLAAGRLIWQSGIPTADVWTYTADKPWVDLYWLPQLVFYGLFLSGGASALVLLKMAAAGGIAALLLAGSPRRAPSWATVAAMVPALLLITGRLRERPEMFSLLYLATFLAIIARGRPRSWLWLPALQILWVNSHGLFVLGPALLAAHLIATIVERRGARAVKLAALALGLSLAACLVNPYGLGVFSHVVQQAHQLQDGLYRRSIVELQTFPELVTRGGWSSPYAIAAMILAVVGVAGFAARGRAPRVFPALLFVVTVFLAWRSVRLVPVFAIVAAHVSLANFAEAFPARRWSRWPPAVVVALACLVLTGALYRWTGDGRVVGLGEARGVFSHGACEWLAQHGPARVVTANITQASVCTWHLRPDQRQFLVSRVEPARDDAFSRYVAGVGGLLRGRGGWETPLGIDYASGDAPAILIERALDRAAENLARNPRWALVYRDGGGSVFVGNAHLREKVNNTIDSDARTCAK